MRPLKKFKIFPHLPYAFTEQGVAMLSGVLKSSKAISVSIQIVDTFISMRKFLQNNADLFLKIDLYTLLINNYLRILLNNSSNKSHKCCMSQ